MKTNYILQFCIAFLIISCSSERIKLLSQAEKVLPGDWYIESIRLPRYGLGITYQGNTFITDTILFNVGSIAISEFSADSLNFLDNKHGRVNCTLRIDNESFPYGIASLFISGEDIFSRFEYNGPSGIETIDTPGEEFIWSSFIFNNNYYISIFDNDNIELGKANDREGHVITLRRF